MSIKKPPTICFAYMNQNNFSLNNLSISLLMETICVMVDFSHLKLSYLLSEFKKLYPSKNVLLVLIFINERIINSPRKNKDTREIFSP
jgi:hypothetical protein